MLCLRFFVFINWASGLQSVRSITDALDSNKIVSLLATVSDVESDENIAVDAVHRRSGPECWSSQRTEVASRPDAERYIICKPVDTTAGSYAR